MCSLIRHSRKVTYILGAGFSYDAGVPLMRNFLADALQILNGSDQPADRDVAKQLAGILQENAGMPRWSQIDLLNLEQLFCLLEPPYGSLTQRNVLTDAIIRTIRRATTLTNGAKTTVPRKHLFLSSNHKDSNAGPATRGVSLYDAFVSYVLSRQQESPTNISSAPPPFPMLDRDAIITFNYDMVIEAACQSFAGACVYYGDNIIFPGTACPPWVFDQPRSTLPDYVLPVFKLHGSVNWACADMQTYRWVNAVTSSPSESSSPASTPLVPPTWRKEAVPGSIFEKLTQESLEHLRRSHEIVIIGYSMPPTDLDFRFLLARVLATPEAPRIRIYNTTSRREMYRRMRQFVSNAMFDSGLIECYDTGLEGFVRSKVSRGNAGL